jgi:hypothetical protein
VDNIRDIFYDCLLNDAYYPNFKSSLWDY